MSALRALLEQVPGADSHAPHDRSDTIVAAAGTPPLATVRSRHRSRNRRPHFGQLHTSVRRADVTNNVSAFRTMLTYSGREGLRSNEHGTALSGSTHESPSSAAVILPQHTRRPHEPSFLIALTNSGFALVKRSLARTTGQRTEGSATDQLSCDGRKPGGNGFEKAGSIAAESRHR